MVAVSLYVIVWPVVGTQEQFNRHVIDILVHVEQLLQLFIDISLLSLFTQLIDSVKNFGSTYHEDNIGVGTHFEHIDFFVIVSEVSLYILLVVGFTHIQHSSELSIHILDDGDV